MYIYIIYNIIIEPIMQISRLGFPQWGGRFAVHFTFLLMLAMAVNFVYDPSGLDGLVGWVLEWYLG